MTGACIFCKATEHLNRRQLGEGGIEVDVCDDCSQKGQQARAVVNTLRPFLPYIERGVRAGVPVLVRGITALLKR